jgi:hypothetical protein
MLKEEFLLMAGGAYETASDHYWFTLECMLFHWELARYQEACELERSR